MTQNPTPQQTVIHVVQAPAKAESADAKEFSELMLKMNERLAGMVESLEHRLAATASEQRRTLKAAESALAEVKQSQLEAARQSIRSAEAPPMPESTGTTRSEDEPGYVLHLGGRSQPTDNVTDSVRTGSSLDAESRQTTGSIELFLGGVRN